MRRTALLRGATLARGRLLPERVDQLLCVGQKSGHACTATGEWSATRAHELHARVDPFRRIFFRQKLGTRDRGVAVTVACIRYHTSAPNCDFPSSVGVLNNVRHPRPQFNIVNIIMRLGSELDWISLSEPRAAI